MRDRTTTLINFALLFLIFMLTDGLGHASETADEFFEGEYGDETSIMGVDDAQTRKCYNVCTCYHKIEPTIKQITIIQSSSFNT